MYAICLRYTSDTHAAEEVLQTGFIKVFESLNRLKDVYALEKFLCGIFVHTAISYYRSMRPVADVDSYVETADDLYADSEKIYSQIDIHIILDAIRQLPERYRSVFNLCQIEGYSFNDAAAELGIQTSSVRSDFFRARAILAQKLQKYREK